MPTKPSHKRSSDRGAQSHQSDTARLESTIAIGRQIKALGSTTVGSRSQRETSSQGSDQGFLAHMARQALEQALDRGNGLVWLVLAMGSGIVVYFALPREPSVWALYGLLIVAIAGTWKARGSSWLFVLSMLTAFVAGIALVTTHARLSDAPQLLYETVGTVQGRIVSLEQRSPSRARVVLRDVVVEDISSDGTPKHVRVVVVADPGDLRVGQTLSVLAQLGPPPEPVMPGARNLRRELYFQQIGATGFSYGRPEIVPNVGTAGFFAGSAAWLHGVRLDLAARFSGQLEGDVGVVAATLLVGVRDGLSDQAYDDLRQAGLAHLLAISGMHMAMVTLSALAVLRIAMAFSPQLAASRTGMRAMALCAFIIAIGYLGLSGASTATQRAFVMIAIALLAFIVARRALTLRAVALAAFIVLILHPESLLGPSFQMSFAATFALVGSYAAFSTSPWVWKARLKAENLGWGLARPVKIVAGIAVTSLIAGLATAPYAAFHFSQGAPLSLLGNVLALPLVSLVIMPSALLVMILTPFGLEALPLTVMGAGIDWVLTIAHWVASLDGARLAIPAITPQALAVLTASGCLLVLLPGRAKLMALFVLAALPFVGVFQPTPTLLVERTGRMVAYVQDGEPASLDRSIRRGSRFAYAMWQQRLALDPDAPTPPTNWSCDPLGCVLTLPTSQVVAHVFDIAAFEEDCRVATILVTQLSVPQVCDVPLILDGATLRHSGAVALLADTQSHSGFAVWPSFANRTRPWQRIEAMAIPR